MTEALKEELRVGPGEDPVGYAERTEAALERHFEETGERLHPAGVLPGEGPGEALERIRKLNEAEGIRRAGLERRRQAEKKTTDAGEEKEGGMTPAEVGTRRFRIKSQERDVERAVSEFGAQEKRLFRADGSKVYGEEEHAERAAVLVSGLREKVQAVVREAEEDAESYQREALALSYSDPASTVPASERGRLEASRAFAKEDCEGLAVGALTERMVAVSAGTDRVAKVLHARYGRMRVGVLDAESDRLAREGSPQEGPQAAQERRNLAAAVEELEAQLADPEKARRAAALGKAASESRRVAWEARRRLRETDGSDERARREHAERARAAF